jgi:hypothetical protein
MKLITNGAGSYLTGDALADAVVRLAVALANVRSTDVVELPFRGSDGATESVTFMLGVHTTVNAATSSVRAEDVVDAPALDAILLRLERAEQHGDTPMRAHELVRLPEFDH